MLLACLDLFRSFPVCVQQCGFVPRGLLANRPLVRVEQWFSTSLVLPLIQFLMLGPLTIRSLYCNFITMILLALSIVR